MVVNDEAVSFKGYSRIVFHYVYMDNSFSQVSCSGGSLSLDKLRLTVRVRVRVSHSGLPSPCPNEWNGISEPASKRTEQDTNHYYLNDCEVISTMPNVKDLLKANLPTLPFQSLDNSSSQQTAEHILDWDDENICLSVGRGNITAFSGSTFHIHKHSVSVLLSGKKHWVIFPPDRIPTMGFNPYENLEQWLLSVQ